jgi:cell division septum initiation protein DivIVA
MDILHLVDRLEELFNQSRAIPLTHQVIVDEDRMLDLIDQMRVSIPEEVKKAQQILSQRDRILAQTQEEASRTLALAREKSEQFVSRDAIVQQAQTKAAQIIAEARREAEAIRNDADEYVIKSLSRLQMELERLLHQVDNGIRTVQRDLMAASPSSPQPSSTDPSEGDREPSQVEESAT